MTLPQPSSSQYLLDSSRQYAIYVCRQRAIPFVGDGLKHGQMIALWLLRNRAEKVKTFALSGLMGYERLYVHGEVSANDMIGKLAAPYKNNIPLIEGLGQFGTRIAPVKGIGAPRYTEVKRAKAAEAILYRDLDLIPLEDNYDGSNKQPMHFLPLIPTVLLNGVSGVAVGWSTDILPRSLKSIIEATKDALLGNPINVLEPYFNRYNIRVRPLATNQWEFSGRAEIVDSSTVRITELPPGMSLESFREKLIAMEDVGDDANPVGNPIYVTGFSDRSTQTIDITIKMKRGSIKGWKEADVVEFFKLREKSTERIVVVNWDGKSIRTYPSAEELVVDFVKWRLAWYTKRFEKLRDDTRYELTYWNALKILFEGGFTKKLGTFADKAALSGEVVSITAAKSIKLDDAQLDRVIALPTYRWTKEFEAEVGNKIAELNDQLKSHIKTLASPALLRQVYLDELEALKAIKG